MIRYGLYPFSHRDIELLEQFIGGPCGVPLGRIDGDVIVHEYKARDLGQPEPEDERSDLRQRAAARLAEVIQPVLIIDG